jgi:hypothetical protein
MSHDKQDRDVERGTMFSGMDVPERDPPPGQGWCPDRTYFPRREMSERKKVRCPTCNRILLPREHHCVGGETLGFVLPMHKRPVKTRKRPSKARGHARRQSR